MPISEPGITIMVDNDDALAFWCQKFGVSPFLLLQAVTAVGSSPRFVGDYLRAMNA